MWYFLREKARGMERESEREGEREREKEKEKKEHKKTERERMREKENTERERVRVCLYWSIGRQLSGVSRLCASVIVSVLVSVSIIFLEDRLRDDYIRSLIF